jgi:hypothetical protein
MERRGRVLTYGEVSRDEVGPVDVELLDFLFSSRIIFNLLQKRVREGQY